MVAREFNLKAQNRLSAAKLKDEMKSMDVFETPENMQAVDSAMDEGEVKPCEELPISLNWVAGGNTFSATLPLPSFAAETVEGMSPVGDHQMVIESSTEKGDDGTSKIQCSDELEILSDATMEVDQSLATAAIHHHPGFSGLMPSPFVDATPSPRPIFNFPTASTFTPYAAPAPQATTSFAPQTATLPNPFTRPGKEPSESSEPLPKPLSKRTPKLKSALPLTKDRIRKVKTRSLTNLFDFESGDEEDWEPADVPVKARPRSGRAMRGDEPAFGTIGGKIPDPEILPAARAHDRLEPTSYQKALLQVSPLSSRKDSGCK